MPVPSSISDLSTNPALNSPPGSESPSSIDDYLRTHAAFIKQINDLAETKADDSSVVKLTGAQAVAGTKTFSASPVVPDATAPKHPVTKDQLDVTKDQLDAKAPIASPAFTGVPTAPNPATGTRSTSIATMQKFADEFVASLAASGYQKLPSGLIIQWGYVQNSNAGQVTVTFPVAFPVACRFFGPNPATEAPLGVDTAQIAFASNTQAVVNRKASGGGSISNANWDFFWLAVGH